MDSEVVAILDSADVEANGKLPCGLETNGEVGLVLVKGSLHVEATWPLFLLISSRHLSSSIPLTASLSDPFYGILNPDILLLIFNFKLVHNQVISHPPPCCLG